MRILVALSLGAALVAAPLTLANAQSLPGADILGKAQAAQSAAKMVGGNSAGSSAMSGAVRDMAVKEATGSIKRKAGDYARQKALETAMKNPKLAGKAVGAASKLGAAGKLKGVGVKDAKGMAADHAKKKLRDAAVSKLTGAR